MSSQIIIYPGTFDPPTFGHLDIIRRGAALGGKLIVAVSLSTSKETLFSIEERSNLLEEEVRTINYERKGMTPIEVKSFSGLLTKFAAQEKANAILRGLRAVADFEYEFQMASINKRLHGELETIFLMAAEQQHFVASRFVKEIAMFNGEVESFVSSSVARALKQKILKK